MVSGITRYVLPFIWTPQPIILYMMNQGPSTRYSMAHADMHSRFHDFTAVGVCRMIHGCSNVAGAFNARVVPRHVYAAPTWSLLRYWTADRGLWLAGEQRGRPQWLLRGLTSSRPPWHVVRQALSECRAGRGFRHIYALKVEYLSAFYLLWKVQLKILEKY
jgi:hypothetical protein